jgi:hypothetical protein
MTESDLRGGSGLFLLVAGGFMVSMPALVLPARSGPFMFAAGEKAEKSL